MKRNFVDALLALPADQTLRDFLTHAGLPLPGDLNWNDGLNTSHALIDAIAAWPDTAARDALIAHLSANVQLGDSAGKQAMFQIAASDAHVLLGLAACNSDLQRSFWLATTHPALFERACEVDYLERHGTQVQQHELDICRRPDTGDAALAGLRQTISSFYQRELGCSDVCLAYVMERRAGVLLLERPRQGPGHAAAGVRGRAPDPARGQSGHPYAVGVFPNQRCGAHAGARRVKVPPHAGRRVCQASAWQHRRGPTDQTQTAGTEPVGAAPGV